MTGFIRDPEVQRRGCAALRVLALNPDKVQGQVLAMCDKGASKLLFECLKEQLKVTDVVLAATAAVWAMAKAGRTYIYTRRYTYIYIYIYTPT